MADIEIISGSFPPQTAALLHDQLIIRTGSGTSEFYGIKYSVMSLDLVSEQEAQTVFDVKLKDGHFFRARARRETFQYLKSGGDGPYRSGSMRTKTAKEGDTAKTIGVAIFIVLLFLMLKNCGGQSPGKPSGFVQTTWGAHPATVSRMLINARFFILYLLFEKG